MTFLVDHDVFAVSVQFLKVLGHDVVSAKELGLAAASDSQLLARAKADQRILVTRDRDYGNLVFVQETHASVIYLRMLPENVAETHAELARVLQKYTKEELLGSFLVIEPGKHRRRQLPKPT